MARTMSLTSLNYENGIPFRCNPRPYIVQLGQGYFWMRERAFLGGASWAGNFASPGRLGGAGMW